MRVLITGNLGFVGQATQKYFAEKGITSIGYDIMAGCDVRDPEQLDAAVISGKGFGPIDRILHLAAIARFSEADKNPKLAFETNAMGTRNVALVAKKHHIPVVYSSTGSTYMPIKSDPPITEDFPVMGNSVYGCSKAVGESYIETYGQEGFPWMILRYAHLYGKEKRMHGLIGGFMDRIQRGLAPTLYGGKQSNDFTYIDDVARANYLAVTAPWDKWNQSYNIGTGEELTAEDAGKMICKMAKWKGKIEKKGQREVDPGRFVYDMTKANVMLGFYPKYPFEAGLKEMFNDSPKSNGDGKNITNRESKS
jgi:nucleoside-diphosphate-sugar epimerase